MNAAEAGPEFELAPLEPAALVEARDQVARAAGDGQVQAYSGALARFVGGEGNDELAEYERMAVLGICAGFVERQLSPYITEHVAIIPPMLDEIRAVYRRLRQLGTAYDPAEFRIRAFHYGVHKASYLDWRLYLSKECY
jgi:hypothetical protein